MRNQRLITRDSVTKTGLIFTLGIIFGSLGTSPLYVMKAVLAGYEGAVDQDFIIGIVSCLIWTLTIQATIKYVFLTMPANNQGEGGIMALYTLIRRKKRNLFLIAILGGSALLADGVLTPSITMVSAVEGLQLKFPNLRILPIALGLITILFLIQKFGTANFRKSFGPFMLIWFVMLTALGLPYLIEMPVMLKAFNPAYAIRILTEYPGGFLLLGAVFLVTSGAEVLYTDLGQCGYKNIRLNWIFVKIALIINYMAQAAWVLLQDTPAGEIPNPFFAIMPAWFLPFGVLLSTAAAIIASQALISGSFSLVSEAISLNFWPKVRINYPTISKGRMYISSVNWILYVFCLIAVVVFRNSTNMAAAYGLAILLTMLMTTILMASFLTINRRNKFLIILFTGTYLLVEGLFLLSNLMSFARSGWFTVLLAGLFGYVMYIWFRGRRIKNRFTRFVAIGDYYEQLRDLSKDLTVPKYSTNLVYLTRADRVTDIESKVIYSIFQKCPKRADTYWLLHVNICDDPHTMEYSVDHLIPGILIRVEFRLGFKVQPRINLLFNEVVNELACKEEISLLSGYPSLRKHDIAADFRFILIHRIHNYDFDFSRNEQFVMDQYTVLSRLALSDIKNYGLDSGSVMTEVVPLSIPLNGDHLLKRVYPG
jgi:KUP system potassium uptake protein